VSDQLTLASAQLALAREYGFSSWPTLKAEVEARVQDLAAAVGMFLVASIRDGSGRAARLLAARPEIAESGFPAAVLLGDVARVRAAIDRDPGIATRVEEGTDWTPLHAVCASLWHHLDPARADGLLAVAQRLLDAGADPHGGNRAGWTPLRCAVAGAANPAIVRLVLERGAVPDDHDLYLACFGDDDRQSVRLLVDHMPNLAESTALAAPISTGDTETVRLLLEAGVDPRRPTPADLYGGGTYQGDQPPPWPTIYGAVRSDCPTELMSLLLDYGADPTAPGPDGRSPYRVAVGQGRDDLAELLLSRGAQDDTTDTERLVAACLRGDHASVRRQVTDDPALLDRLTDAEPAALVTAAENGNAAAMTLMLDFGFPIEARGEVGETSLHAAAYTGNAEVVRLLLDRGADLEARDTTWDSTPVVWAKVGSGERPTCIAAPDWVTTISILIDAGASLVDITLSPDDGKPPSPEVAELLRRHGVREER
jgi:ankyrin repeat protein